MIDTIYIKKLVKKLFVKNGNIVFVRCISRSKLPRVGAAVYTCPSTAKKFPLKINNTEREKIYDFCNKLY